MSGYLLDTHTLLSAFEGASDLSRRAGRLIEDSANDVVISIVVYWELQIKQTIGKLRVAREYNERLWEWFDACGFTRLGLQRSHCDRYRALPLHHRDPFDRMLIAQAQVEGLSILSADPRFKKYDVKVVWRNEPSYPRPGARSRRLLIGNRFVTNKTSSALISA